MTQIKNQLNKSNIKFIYKKSQINNRVNKRYTQFIINFKKIQIYNNNNQLTN